MAVVVNRADGKVILESLGLKKRDPARGKLEVLGVCSRA